MGNVYLDDSILTGIANAIRAKTGGSSSITPANMATEISGITAGGGGSAVVSSYTSTTSISNSTAVDTRIAAVLGDHDFDDIALWIIRDEYSNNIFVYDKSDECLILNGSCDGVSGRYVAFKYYFYNTSYGLYKENKVTKSSNTYSLPSGFYLLFIPNSGTNCYWVAINQATNITEAQKEANSYNYTNKRTAPMSGTYNDDPTYGGKIIRQWVVANS